MVPSAIDVHFPSNDATFSSHHSRFPFSDEATRTFLSVSPSGTADIARSSSPLLSPSQIAHFPSETKLLCKILQVAQQLEQQLERQLEQRASHTFPTRVLQCERKRRVLLLTALAVVSRKMGVGAKLLQLEHIVSVLVDVLGRVSLDVAFRMVAANKLDSLTRDLRQARQLQTLHILRSAAQVRRNLRQGTFISHEPFNGMRMLTGDLRPFLVALERRQHNMSTTVPLQDRVTGRTTGHATNRATDRATGRAMANSLQDPAHFSSQDSTQMTSTPAETMRRMLKLWRNLLNFRLVRARTRRRMKHVVLSNWRRTGRVSTIANIFYGKKVKLRSINRWFSRRFGRTRDRLLTV